MLAAENITVLRVSPIYTSSPKSIGDAAYVINPATVSTGISRTVFVILNLCEKNENMRFITSYVQKLMSTSNSRSEYEMPHYM